MSTQDKNDGAPGTNQLTGHAYDGISEYDNPIPGWWHAIFLGSILFSVVYMAVFHLSSAKEKLRPEARLARAQERAAAESFALLGELKSDGPSLMLLSTSELAVGKGKSIFASKGCVACHGPNAGGVPGLGLNLTDDYGKNLRTPEDVFHTISQGVTGTAMLGFEAQMGKDDTILAAAYVISLRGTNTPDGIPPEGELMPEWTVPDSDD
ncbi:MAG: cbb3-type cytochrome c oxidase N-terminal domain-containing protein [Planctomycetota bacterium]|nr:cbb3-type cytochrome c oxidase N-terminal domain-containing protein [Planctomycetota bacterium]